MDRNVLIDEYMAGPEILRDAVAGMSQEELIARPIAGKWSTLEVVAHLADFEPVYADRMKRVLVEDNPPLPGGDPDAFAARLAYHERDLEVELNLIENVRRQMVTILRHIDSADFERTGNHSEDGPLSITQLLHRITGHIPHHIRFIKEKREAMHENG